MMALLLMTKKPKSALPSKLRVLGKVDNKPWHVENSSFQVQECLAGLCSSQHLHVCRSRKRSQDESAAAAAAAARADALARSERLKSSSRGRDAAKLAEENKALLQVLAEAADKNPSLQEKLKEIKATYEAAEVRDLNAVLTAACCALWQHQTAFCAQWRHTLSHVIICHAMRWCVS